MDPITVQQGHLWISIALSSSRPEEIAQYVTFPGETGRDLPQQISGDLERLQHVPTTKEQTRNLRVYRQEREGGHVRTRGGWCYQGLVLHCQKRLVGRIQISKRNLPRDKELVLDRP
jgi:hypothetical protein